MKTIEQLSELRARLVRAQRRENAAIRKMSEFSLKGGDRATFKRLLDDVHRARVESVALYEQWNAAVQMTQTPDDEGARQGTSENGGSRATEEMAPPPNAASLRSVEDGTRVESSVDLSAGVPLGSIAKSGVPKRAYARDPRPFRESSRRASAGSPRD